MNCTQLLLGCQWATRFIPGLGLGMHNHSIIARSTDGANWSNAHNHYTVLLECHRCTA